MSAPWSTSGGGWDGDSLAGRLSNNSSIRDYRPVNVLEQVVIGSVIALHCITFLRCSDTIESKQLFRQATWALCSSVTKNTLSKSAELQQTRVCVT
jgi:hypothetical protein